MAPCGIASNFHESPELCLLILKVLVHTFVQWFCLRDSGLIVRIIAVEAFSQKGGDCMLSKCANPRCANTFRYFGEGKLYVSEPKAQAGNHSVLECFWLCSTCCRDMTVQIDDDHAVTVLRKPAKRSELAHAVT